MTSNDTANDGDEIRVQVPVKEEYIQRIDALAKRMGVGRGRMIAMLVEAGVDDNEWIINVVTSKFMAPVVNLVKGWSKGKPQQKGGMSHA